MFLEEVELGKLGIFYEGGGRFSMKTPLKERFLGEMDLKQVRSQNLVNDIKNGEIKTDGVAYRLISYIHQFYSVGDIFTLGDVFGEYWYEIAEIPRIEIGTYFATEVHSGTTGIIALKTSGSNTVKQDGKKIYRYLYCRIDILI